MPPAFTPNIIMKSSHKALWTKSLQFIKENIGDSLFLTWFSDVEWLRFENNEIHVLVPSSFFAEYIDKNFFDVVMAAIKKFFGDGIDLYYHYNIARGDADTRTGGKSVPDKKTAVSSEEAPIAPSFGARNIPPVDPQLNPQYTFRNYCCSDSNKVAVSIGEAISAHPEKNQFNPLFVFGTTGVGKTHLIQAIGASIKEHAPANRVLYVTARLFMSQYTTAVTQGQTNMFFNFYQSIDTLIVDDVQDFNGKQSTQNTFYHIFNHLYLNNRRIILSSDRSPAEMEGFEERLLGRFKCGMSVSLEKPDIKLRREVLALKARQEGIDLSDDIIDYIARNVTESVRELEGVMVSLVAHAAILNKPISLELAHVVVQTAIKIKRHKINFEIIVREVSGFYGLEPDVFFTKSRKREISDARQVVMYLAKKHTDMPSTSIGRKLGRSHSTVIYAVGNIEERLDYDKALRAEIEQIEEALNR